VSSSGVDVSFLARISFPPAVALFLPAPPDKQLYCWSFSIRRYLFVGKKKFDLENSGRGRIDCRRDGWSDVVAGGWNIGGLRTLALDFGGLLHYRRHVGRALTRLDFFASSSRFYLIEHQNQTEHRQPGQLSKKNSTILDRRKDLGILFRSFRRSFISGPFRETSFQTFISTSQAFCHGTGRVKAAPR
jgi:hypothetical protein